MYFFYLILGTVALSVAIDCFFSGREIVGIITMFVAAILLRDWWKIHKAKGKIYE